MFSRKKHCTAHLGRIWHSAPPGGNWQNWTYVSFIANGRPIDLRLTRRQAKAFLVAHGVGELGHLEYSGKRLVAWEPVPVSAFSGTPGCSVYISHAPGWQDEASYIGHLFGTKGLEATLGGQVEVRGTAAQQAVDGISGADVVLALICTEYLSSVRGQAELEACLVANKPLVPLAVADYTPAHCEGLSPQQQALVKHARRLDLRAKNPRSALIQLAEHLLVEFPHRATDPAPP